MVPRRAGLALGALLLRIAAGVDDESCLVQSQKDVVSRREAVLESGDAPALPTLPLFLQHMDLSSLRAVFQPVPMMPGMDGGGQGTGIMSMEDLMGIAMEILDLLEKHDIADRVLEKIHDVSHHLLDLSNTLLASATKLDAAVDNATEEPQVVEAVVGFVTTMEKTVLRVVAGAWVGCRPLWVALPDGLPLKTKTAPFRAILANFTTEQVTAFLEQAVTPFVDVVSGNPDAICELVGPYVGSISAASEFVQTKGRDLLATAKVKVQHYAPMVRVFRPDIAPTVMKLANATIDIMDQVGASLLKSVPIALSVANKAVTGKLRCYSPSAQSEQSGAHLARASFSMAMVVAAAWMLGA